MIKRKCKQCGKEFVLSDSEIKFFNDKNLELPKRCSSCRKENKNKEYNIDSNKRETVNNNYKDNSYNNYKNNVKKKTFKNIIAAGLFIVVLLLGKLLNIDTNLQEIRTNFGTEKNNISLEFRNETGLMSIFWTQKVKLFYAALLANNSH